MAAPAAGAPSCGFAPSPAANGTWPRFSISIASSCAIPSPAALSLNALPMPVWFRAADGRLEWVNEAYVKAVDAGNDAEVRERQIELLETRQRDAVKAALDKGTALPRRGCISSARARARRTTSSFCRWMAPPSAPPSTWRRWRRAQGELMRHVAAYERTLDRVATGVAIFGPDQRLAFFNEAYRKLWLLGRRLAGEQAQPTAKSSTGCASCRGYRRWVTTAIGRSRSWSATRTGTEYDDWWHLLDGRTIHVVSAQRPDGGLTYLYDDVTERFALESRYNALIDAQRETLDNLKEGVAVVRHRRPPQAFQSRPSRRFGASRAARWARARTSTRSSPSAWGFMRTCRPGRASAVRSRASPIAANQLAAQMTRSDQAVIDFAVSPLPDERHAHHLRQRHRHQALRADADRAQRRAGGGRSSKEPVHQPRLLRAAHAADQHHRLRRAPVQSAHRRAQQQAARVL